ncbi:MAG: SpoVA/SpoVAEb family sporulation membrane protein [Eubacteriales bacterium]|nr:SpoVA/SpoVAEb family sporulation membrane protein [Eubacteriales bacterium]
MEIFLNLVKAFAVGGFICVLAQLLVDYTKLTPARILTGCVVLGVILSAIGIFEPIKEFAGAGVSVPLLGFGDVIAAGVRDEIDIKGPMGIITGGLTAAAAGVSAAVFFSLLASVFGKSRMKS